MVTTLALKGCDRDAPFSAADESHAQDDHRIPCRIGDHLQLGGNQGILPFEREEELTTLVAGVAYTKEIADLVREASGGEVITWDYGHGLSYQQSSE